MTATTITKIMKTTTSMVMPIHILLEPVGGPWLTGSLSDTLVILLGLRIAGQTHMG
jgi:hypothetical protein